MNRTQGILAAGTLTGLVLITVLALGFGNLQAKPAEDATAAPLAAEVSSPQTNGMSNVEALQAWQAYSADLEKTVRILQERESAYEQQIDLANQTILQLQGQINSANNVPAYSDDDGYGHAEYEREEYEHEEHEREEHGYEEYEYEFGEDFD